MDSEISNNMNGTMDCSLCCKSIEDTSGLQCGHIICEKCSATVHIETLTDVSPCPLCYPSPRIANGHAPSLQTCNLCEWTDYGSNSTGIAPECDGNSNSLYRKTDDNLAGDSCLQPPLNMDNDMIPSIVTEDIQSEDLEMEELCKEHPNESSQGMCTSCNTFVCAQCHGDKEDSKTGHCVMTASELTAKLRDQIPLLIDRAQNKMASVESRLRLASVENAKVEVILEQRIAEINQAYEDAVAQLSQKRNELVDKCKRLKTSFAKDLHEINERNIEFYSDVDSVNNYIDSDVDTLLQDDPDLASLNALCSHLKEMLDRDDPSAAVPGIVTRRAEKTRFVRFKGKNELDLGELREPRSFTQSRRNVKQDWTLQKVTEYPLSGYMFDMTPTKDGMMAVGYIGGGIELFSESGPQKTILKDVNVYRLSILSDYRYVVRDTYNKVCIYTPEGENLDVKFNTLSYPEGGLGGMDVDDDDIIYVGYMDAKRIHVFRSIGGSPMKEIECHGYAPWEINVLNSSGTLVVNDKVMVRVIDIGGIVKHKVARSGFNASPAVPYDDGIVIGWVKGDLINIDLYTYQLKYVRSLITNFKIDRGCEFWPNCLREFSTGQLALCTQHRSYIFNKA